MALAWPEVVPLGLGGRNPQSNFGTLIPLLSAFNARL
jgi:hypothetical protein